MQSGLLDLVKAELLPAVASHGVVVEGQESSTSFDNASVTLAAGELRFRVVRERSQLFVDFGSAAKPHAWFDSAVVAEYLGLGRDGGFHSGDAAYVLRGLAEFLKTFWNDLVARFGADRFIQTERELIAVRKARDAARWGS